MKAIKIASGVAISALAAAISAQAHAEGDTEFSWTATGSMEAVFVYDFEGETKDVDLDEEDDFDSQTAGEAWGIEVTNTVVHGPFSANIVFTADDASGDTDTADDNVSVAIEDLVVTDGAFSFGQLDSLVDATPAYVYDMDDSEDLSADDGIVAAYMEGQGATQAQIDAVLAAFGDLDEGADVGAAIRYTMGDLKVQIEGQNDYLVQEDTGFGDFGAETEGTVTDYGVAASYGGSMDALSYVVEAQVRASDDAVDSADPYTYLGAGATYAMDMVEVAAAVNRWSIPDLTSANGVEEGKKDAILEYGFSVTVTPIEAASLYVKGRDIDAGNTMEDIDDSAPQFADTAKFLFGGTYTVQQLTFTGEYTFTTLEEQGDEVLVEVAYADGPIGGYVSVELENFDADTANAPLFEAGVSYTQDNGVMYAADYDFRAEEEDAIDSAAINTLKLGASYAF